MRNFFFLSSALALSCGAPALADQADKPRAALDLRQVSLAANPTRVCADRGPVPYLNFDLVIRNGSAADLEVAELRGIVLDPQGRVIERRLIWQQAIGLLAPDRAVPAKGEAMIFNPLLLRSAQAGSRVRFEVDFAGQVTGSNPLTLTVTPEDCTNEIAFVSPVSGRLLVYDGYDLYSHHRRTGYGGAEDAAMGLVDNFQRFGIDLVMVDEQGRFFTGDGLRPDQWHGWGKTVRAVADGRVAAVHDGQPDNEVIWTVDRWVDRDMKKNPMTSYGNYVLIDHGSGEFTLAAHLRNGSVSAKRGDRVRQGQAIGKVGNSGASGGVHVHFERRTGQGIAGIKTLPPSFHGVTPAGGNPGRVEDAVPLNTGDVVIAR